MEEIQSDNNKKSRRTRFNFDGEDGPDAHDNEIYNECETWQSGFDTYFKVARAYVTGDMEKFNQLTGPQKKKNCWEEVSESEYDTILVDELILYATGVLSESEQEHEQEQVSDDESDDEYEPGYDKETAQAIISAILAHANENPRCFDPDNILSLAVEHDPHVVQKLLELPIDLHPAYALPKVDYKGQDGDLKYAAIQQLLLADQRVHDVNIHAVTWAAYQGDLDKLNALLNNPALVISEGAERAIYWAIRQANWETFERLVQDPRFNNPETILLLLTEKKPFQYDHPYISLMSEYLFKYGAGDANIIYSEILYNATEGKVLPLIKELLEFPIYSDAKKKLDQDKVRFIFHSAVVSPAYSKHRDETCALLNKHLKMEDKSKFIVEQSIFESHFHYYVRNLILNDDEMLDLIQCFDSCSPLITQILWTIVNMIEERSYTVGSFDKSILKIYEMAPRGPAVQTWTPVCNVFERANRVSSLETLLQLAAQLKAETDSDHYRWFIVRTLTDKYAQHVNCEIQQQKIDAFMATLHLADLDIVKNDSYYAFSSTAKIDTTVIEAIQLMSPWAFDQLLADAEAKGNKLLSNELHKIKGDVSAEALLKECDIKTFAYQAYQQQCERADFEEEAQIAREGAMKGQLEEAQTEEEQPEEEEIFRSESPSL